jgi:hypothetical protein
MTLNAEVQKFKLWAATHPLEQRSAEWECEYDDWARLHAAALACLDAGFVDAGFVDDVSPDQWCAADVDDLLYTMARDNETEYLAEHVAKNPETVLKLAALSLSSAESDAKWQLAAQLGKLHEHKEKSEAILLQLVHDENDYVARRALLALGELHSGQAEAHAEQAWNTGLEYQRIAALSVLAHIASAKLDGYIQRAIDDGRQSVVQHALKIQRQRTSAS